MEEDDKTECDNEPKLCDAATQGDVESVRKLLANKTNLNWQIPAKYCQFYQRGALHEASRYNHSAIIGLLLAHGANTDLKDAFGQTPIYLASNHGQTEALTMLIDGGADIEIASDGGVTPVMIGWKVEIMESLIDAHANLQQTDDFGRTALHWAVWANQSEIVSLLLQKDIDARKQDNEGQTAADYARKYEHHQLADIIDSFTGSTSPTSQTITTVPTAQSTTATSTVPTGQPSTTAPPTTASSTGQTITTDIIMYNELDLYEAAERGDVEYVEKALANKTNPNWQNPRRFNQTALHQASSNNHPEVVKLLLGAGANRDLQEEYGDTAVLVALKYNKKEAATVLTDGGIDLFNAATRGDVAYVYKALANKINPNWQNPFESQRTALHQASRYNNPAVIRSLVAAGVDKNLQDRWGETPIFLASQWASLEALTTLIDCGADVEIANNLNGGTPVMTAKTSSILKALIDAHADLTKLDDSGMTALHRAAYYNKLDQAQLLLQKGLDPRKQDNEGMTPADRARKNEHHELADIIDNFTSTTATTGLPITTASAVP